MRSNVEETARHTPPQAHLLLSARRRSHAESHPSPYARRLKYAGDQNHCDTKVASSVAKSAHRFGCACHTCDPRLYCHINVPTAVPTRVATSVLRTKAFMRLGYVLPLAPVPFPGQHLLSTLGLRNSSSAATF